MSAAFHPLIFHYHLRPGGVYTLIEQSSKLFAQAGIAHTLLTGPAERVDWPLCCHVCHPLLGYGEGQAAPLATIIRGLPTWPTHWWLHNPTLGKNPALPALVSHLAESGTPLLLQIHDFIEDQRLENLAHVAQPEQLYPFAANVHYAVLNPRDREILIRAGLPASQAHVLPNPIAAAPLPPPAKGHFSAPRLLYPVRAIPRKNLAEVLLLAAAAPPGSHFWVTLPPLHPNHLLAYERWHSLARELGLAVDFAVGLKRPLAALESESSHFLSTSVQEGFGYVYWHSIARQRPLLARRLPHLWEGFLPTPLGHCWNAIGSDRSPVDFPLLPRSEQERLIAEPYRALIYPHGAEPEPLGSWLARALSTAPPIPPLSRLAPFAPEAYLQRLRTIFEAIVALQMPVALRFLSHRTVLASFVTPNQ